MADPDPVRILSISVSAKHSLWYAWAPSGFSGPEGETEAQSRPLFFPINGEASLDITAAGTWRHGTDPATQQSGPDGLAHDSRGLENPAYKHATYNSDGIVDFPTNLNKLVGIFQVGLSGPTTMAPATPFAIGSGGTFPVPPNATKLFLGHHDGREWSNNDGSVTVTIAPTPPLR